jgi:Ni,Fe-hydrogenase maturation factor
VPPAPAARLRRILREARRSGRRVLVLGVGNELHADDAVGFLIARDLGSGLDGSFHAEAQRRREDPEASSVLIPDSRQAVLHDPAAAEFMPDSPHEPDVPSSLRPCASALSSGGSPRLIAVPVGTALENAAGLVVRHAADEVFLVDAVRPPRRNARAWAFYEPDRLDAFIHSTHSVPMRLLVQWWRQERPGIGVHFLGIRIADTTPFAALTPAVELARREIAGIFRSILLGS